MLNAASSFSNARRVLVRGFAHWVCVSAATAAGMGEVALIAPGLAAVVLVVPGIVLKTALRSVVGCMGAAPGIGEVMGPVAVADVAAAAAADAAAAVVGSADSYTHSFVARSTIISFNCWRRVQKCVSDLDSSMTARRKIELMARCNVIHERDA